MIQSMRSAVASWWVRLLVIMIGVSMVSFYGFQGDSLGRGVVASVNGEEISYRDLQMVLQNYQARFGENVPPALLQSLRTFAVDSLIQQTLAKQQAQAMGWHVAKQEVRNVIRQQFVGDTGKFDFDLYRRILDSQFGKTPSQFETQVGGEILAQQFSQILTDSAWLSLKDLEIRYATQNDKVQLTYVHLDPNKLQKVLTVPTPSLEQQNEEFTANQHRYQVAEQRDLEIAWVSLDQFIGQPDESELQQVLRKLTRNTKPEQALKEQRVHVRQIQWPVEGGNPSQAQSSAHQLLQVIQTGTPFDQAISHQPEPGQIGQFSDLGFVAVSSLPNNLQQVLKGLKKGSVSQPIEVDSRYALIELVDLIAAGDVNIDRLKPELIYTWKTQKLSAKDSQEQLYAQAEDLLNQLKGESQGTSLLPVAKTLDIKTLLVRQLKPQDRINNLPDARDQSLITAHSRSLEQNAIGTPLRSMTGTYTYLVRVANFTPNRNMSFDEAKPLLIQDMLKKMRVDGLQAYAQQTLQTLKAGQQSLSSYAKPLSLEVVDTPDLIRNHLGNISGLGVNKKALTEAFSLTAGTLLSEPMVMGDDVYLLQVKERHTPDWDRFNREQSELAAAAVASLGPERVQTWLNLAAEQAKIKRTTLQ